MPSIALIDCNNFYVSCERVFNPRLSTYGAEKYNTKIRFRSFFMLMTTQPLVFASSIKA
jgi:hypothetical protein